MHFVYQIISRQTGNVKVKGSKTSYLSAYTLCSRAVGIHLLCGILKRDQALNIHCRTHAGVKKPLHHSVLCSACLDAMSLCVCVCLFGMHVCVFCSCPLESEVRVCPVTTNTVSLCAQRLAAWCSSEPGECQTWAALALLIYRFKSPACRACPPTGTRSRTHPRAGWTDV